MQNYVPAPSRAVLRVQYIVQPGDTPSRICERFGLSWAAYPELVGANLHYPLAMGRMPQGHAATLAALYPQQRLRLPASWGKALAKPGVRLAQWGPPDAVVSVADKQLHDIIDAHGGSEAELGWKLAWMARILAASVAWFRQAHPNGVPTAQRLLPYTLNAISWAQRYGGAMSEEQASYLPWNEVPWAIVPWDKVPWLAVRWGTVAAWCKANIPPGAVQNKLVAVLWDKQDFSLGMWAQVPWSVVPWSMVPWSLIPWDKIDWASVTTPPAGTGFLQSDATHRLIMQLRPLTKAAQDPTPCPQPAGPAMPGKVWDTHLCKWVPVPHPSQPHPSQPAPTAPPAPPPPPPADAGTPWGRLIAAAFVSLLVVEGYRTLTAAPPKRSPRR